VSGAEIAGVILASFPLFSSALENYAQSLTVIRKHSSNTQRRWQLRQVRDAAVRCQESLAALQAVALSDAQGIVSDEEHARLYVLSKSSLALASRFFEEGKRLSSTRRIRRKDNEALESVLLQASELCDHLEEQVILLTRYSCLQRSGCRLHLGLRLE
jgi:hypothetical protein